MSATGRKGGNYHGVRGGGGRDYFPTPAWPVHALLRRLQLPAGQWLEPCCGDGAIIRAVNEVRTDVVWDAADIRDTCGYPGADICDFLQLEPPAAPIYDVACTNPPFSLALPFVQQSLRFARQVVMLLRIGFIETEERSEWLLANPFDLYALSARPSFDGVGTDATVYGFFSWPGNGQLVLLPDRPPRRGRRRPVNAPAAPR